MNPQMGSLPNHTAHAFQRKANTMYDIIVIGAGPTGSSAARELAANGYRVLLVEKFRMPRNKSCSGILIRKSVELVGAYFGEDVPHSVTCAPSESRGIVFTNDAGQEYRYEQSGLNIWRSAFDAWLAGKAAEAGAELRDATAAVRCEEQADRVTVTLKGPLGHCSESARIVIACDGAVSTIRRGLTRARPDNVITYQTFHTGSIDLDPHYFYAYLQPQFSGYDAWFNVKDDSLIFGVSAQDPSRISHYYAEFIAYMKARHNAIIRSQEKTERWIMPRVIPGCPVEHGRGRVLFAGETAGFLNPMGEGISSGLESGHAAARAILQASFGDMPAVHAAYKEGTAELKTYMERQWRLVAGLSDKFAHMR